MALTRKQRTKKKVTEPKEMHLRKNMEAQKEVNLLNESPITSRKANIRGYKREKS
jgi:hypothetical protein